MATVVQANTANTGFDSSLGVALTGVAAGNSLILIARKFVAYTWSSVSSSVDGSFGSADYDWGEASTFGYDYQIFSLHSVSSGDHTVTATPSDSSAMDLWLFEVSGLDGSVEDGTALNYTGFSTSASSSSITAADGSLIIGACVVNPSTTIAGASGTNTEPSSPTEIAALYKVQSGAGSTTLDATLGATNDTYIGIIEYTAGGGGATVSPEDESQSQSLDDATITEAAIASPADAAQTQSLDTPAIAEAAVVSPADLSQSQSLETPAAVESGAVNPEELTQSITIETPAIAEAAVVAVGDVAQSQALETPAIAEAAAVGPVDLSQAQEIETPAMAFGQDNFIPLLLQRPSPVIRH